MKVSSRWLEINNRNPHSLTRVRPRAPLSSLKNWLFQEVAYRVSFLRHLLCATCNWLFRLYYSTIERYIKTRAKRAHDNILTDLSQFNFPNTGNWCKSRGIFGSAGVSKIKLPLIRLWETEQEMEKAILHITKRTFSPRYGRSICMRRNKCNRTLIACMCCATTTTKIAWLLYWDTEEEDNCLSSSSSSSSSLTDWMMRETEEEERQRKGMKGRIRRLRRKARLTNERMNRHFLTMTTTIINNSNNTNLPPSLGDDHFGAEFVKFIPQLFRLEKAIDGEKFLAIALWLHDSHLFLFFLLLWSSFWWLDFGFFFHSVAFGGIFTVAALFHVHFFLQVFLLDVVRG